MRSMIGALAAVALSAGVGEEIKLTPATAQPQPKPLQPNQRISIADAMRETGTTSPSAAKRAKEQAIGRKLVYLPHVGAKQRAKAEKLRLKMLAAESDQQ